MRKILTLKRIFIGVPLLLMASLLIYVFVDSYQAYAPQNFRTMQDPILTAHVADLRGLPELQASGGSAPLFADLEKQLQGIKLKKIIFDTRNQPYGYVKAIPSKFFCYHRSPDLRHLPRRLIYTGTIQKRPELFRSEAEEAKQYGFGHVKISLGSRYLTPDLHVDAFVDFIDSLPEDTWVHFHCDRGKGRTSMALAMFDMMKNAPTVALQDIVERQHLLGSEDLFDTEVQEGGSYTAEMLEARKKFLEDFYAFICQRKRGGFQRWSAWRHQVGAS